jgi:hypothetical protein
MGALFARWYCARVVFGEMRLGAHSASWEWCRPHRGGVAVELAPATAGARAEGEVFFDVATVVKEVESKTYLSDATPFQTACISACMPASASISRQREVQMLPNFTPVILRW